MSVDCAVGVLTEVVDATEYGVGWWIATTVLPPSFDHSPVIAVNLDVLALWVAGKDRLDQELESHGLGPPNVAFVLFPPGDKTPGAPVALDDDPDTERRAGV